MGVGANGGRAGARVLALLAAPVNALVLHKLAKGPRRLADLRRETGSPQTTLRARLEELVQVNAVAKRRLHVFPSVREYVLTGRAGSELRFVATTLEAWLARAPAGNRSLGGEGARAAVRALIEAWSSTMLRRLGDGPMTLAELDRAIPSLSAQALERRLAALQRAELVAATSQNANGNACHVTDWLRLGMAPLAAAARWERRYLPDATPPLAPLDAEAGFLLTLPLLRLPAELAGSCRLGVEFADGDERRLAGVTVDVEDGRIARCTTRLESNPAAWATGPPATWLRVAIEADPDRLEIGGDRRLVRALVDALNGALFAPASRFARPG